jgi:hypothetical protein
MVDRGISASEVAGGSRWTARGRSAGLRLVLLLRLVLEGEDKLLLWATRPGRGEDGDFEDDLSRRAFQDLRPL